jgi:hypothetical protein
VTASSGVEVDRFGLISLIGPSSDEERNLPYCPRCCVEVKL